MGRGDHGGLAVPGAVTAGDHRTAEGLERVHRSSHLSSQRLDAAGALTLADAVAVPQGRRSLGDNGTRRLTAAMGQAAVPGG
jgi:hypothetical protein